MFFSPSAQLRFSLFVHALDCFVLITRASVCALEQHMEASKSFLNAEHQSVTDKWIISCLLVCHYEEEEKTSLLKFFK